jgi:HPt (histidine-containing phosphotransfer) domain-containing protein
MPHIEPLVSTLARDPALRPVVARFATGLAARLEAITTCVTAGDHGRAAELAHQLAGAAGMHGFAPIAEAARGLEHDLRGRDTSAQAGRLDVLHTLCARARAD